MVNVAVNSRFETTKSRGQRVKALMDKRKKRLQAISGKAKAQTPSEEKNQRNDVKNKETTENEVKSSVGVDKKPPTENTQEVFTDLKTGSNITVETQETEDASLGSLQGEDITLDLTVRTNRLAEANLTIEPTTTKSDKKDDDETEFSDVWNTLENNEEDSSGSNTSGGSKDQEDKEPVFAIDEIPMEFSNTFDDTHITHEFSQTFDGSESGNELKYDNNTYKNHENKKEEHLPHAKNDNDTVKNHESRKEECLPEATEYSYLDGTNTLPSQTFEDDTMPESRTFGEDHTLGTRTFDEDNVRGSRTFEEDNNTLGTRTFEEDHTLGTRTFDDDHTLQSLTYEEVEYKKNKGKVAYKENDEESTHEAPPLSPTSRMIDSFQSLFQCNGSKSPTNRPFDQRAAEAANAVKSVYSEGAEVVREMLGESLEGMEDWKLNDWKSFSKQKMADMFSKQKMADIVARMKEMKQQVKKRGERRR